MEKIRNKVNYLKNKIINHKRLVFIILGIMIVIIIIFAFFIISSKYNLVLVSNDGDEFKNEYESLNDELTDDGKEYPKVNISGTDIIKYSSIEDLLDILDDGCGVIYFGSADCLYCRNAVQVLMDTAKKSKLKDLYYLDIKEVWDEKEIDNNGNVITVKEADDNYDKLIDELGDKYLTDYILINDKGEKVDVNEKRVEIPLVIFVVDGNIVSSNVGTLFSQVDPYTPMDDSQVEGLSEIYKYGIRDVLEGLNNSQ